LLKKLDSIDDYDLFGQHLGHLACRLLLESGQEAEVRSQKMFILAMVTILTIHLALALAFFAMKAALWLICQTRETRLELEAREALELAGIDGISAFRPSLEHISRAA
jgi:membrane-anchored protein YejM (alkaline phosphatase superfamily)